VVARLLFALELVGRMANLASGEALRTPPVRAMFDRL
jgi:hypothetical protein